ncbi:MAG: AsmA family protein [Bacteroidales bacterium]|nr:AsmA family protein [Bacteroidales bacterium]
MKKWLKISAAVLAALILIIMAAAIVIPVAFREKIKEKVESGLNGKLNAKVTFADYRLSLLKSFPDASFALENLNVTGLGEFEGDTLAAVNSVGLVFNLFSLFGEKGYEIKSIIIDKPFLNAIVSSAGSASWDIMKEEAQEPDAAEGPLKEADQESGQQQVQEAATGGTKPLNLILRRFEIRNGRLRYTDLESDMSAAVDKLDFHLSGKMSGSRTALDLDMKAGGVDFVMDGIPWLTGADMVFTAGVDALLDSMKFILSDNVFRINDISLSFSGMAAMPGDDIELDMIFSAPETSFKSLLSLVPLFYMKGYENLRATGTMALDGAVKGVYSQADSTLPDVSLNLLVSDGMISYPALPEKISDINIAAKLLADGKELDNTTVDVSLFHFELAGNPFDMNLSLATPVSDPSVTATARGKVDLVKLRQAVPLDSITLNGLLDISLDIAGSMSMIENGEYDKFRATGNLSLSGMAVAMADMPELKVSNASFAFSPEYAELTGMNATMGKGSDFAITGRLGNYIPYLFSDGVVRGNLSLRSEKIDLNEIMDFIPSDTVETDTVPMEVFGVPENIDFTFDALVGRLEYGRLSASDVKGNITVRDGSVTVRETGMKALGGTLLVNAVYDTRDTLNPLVDAGMVISTVNIKEAFSAFNTVRQLMPAASGLGGTVSARIDFRSKLGKGMMPLLNTLSGTGEVSSESVQIVESKSFEKMKSILKMNPSYTNIIKDLRAKFIINDGRIYLKPFDTRLGNIKLNISGDQGLDRTLHYLVRTEIPRGELGEAAGALMSSLASQAAALGFSGAPPEMIKVNLNVGGTILDPSIVPSFAGGSVSSAVAAAADTVRQEVVEKVNQAARQQADRILKEAEEKAQMLRDEAVRSAGVIRTEAGLRGEKLVKDAGSRGPIAVAAARKAADALNREADRKASQLVDEANRKADAILAEAAAKADELLK